MHWLDKVIAEQAAHYGLSVERFARLMGGAAEHQQRIEAGLEREVIADNRVTTSTD